MSNDLLMQAIVTDTAKNVIAAMDEEAKQGVFVKAIYNVLNNYDFKYEVGKFLRTEAEKFMSEHIKKPEIQEQIKEKVLVAVGEVMDGLARSMADRTESELKNNYSKWVKDNG